MSTSSTTLAPDNETDVAYAAWSEWQPASYLAEYYQEVMPDERNAMEFLVESMRKVGPVPLALDFGCGPTVHHLFPLLPKVEEFHLSEYLKSNRDEVERWLQGESAHDWLPFSLETLRLEGAVTGDEPPDAIEPLAHEREQQVRDRVSAVMPGDAGDENPLGIEKRAAYPLVTSHYCAEGATNDKLTWRRYMRNIAGLVAPAGTLILSACGAANFYCVGDRLFPCAGVTAQDVLLALQEDGFGDIDLRVRLVPDHSEQGYGSVIFAYGVKSSA
jgi:hypothetical protein